MRSLVRKHGRSSMGFGWCFVMHCVAIYFHDRDETILEDHEIGLDPLVSLTTANENRQRSKRYANRLQRVLEMYFRLRTKKPAITLA